MISSDAFGLLLTLLNINKSEKYVYRVNNRLILEINVKCQEQNRD